jgi:tetratricopeptide (TPR) repeat protein
MKLALFSLLLAAFPAAAFAQPAAPTPAGDPIAQGREFFNQGKRYFELADYPHAIEAWKQAYLIAPTPILLFNIGQAYRLSGDCVQAGRFYANYEREQANPPNKDELDKAKALCAAAPPPKPVDQSKPTEPPPPPLTSAQLGSADLDGGSNTTAKAVPVKPPPPPGSDGSGLKIAGISTAGVGAAFAIAGLVFGTKASSDSSTVTSSAGPWTAALGNTESAGKRDSTIAAVTLTVGGAAILGGAAMYLLGMHSSRTREHDVGVIVVPGQAEVTWAAHF